MNDQLEVAAPWSVPLRAVTLRLIGITDCLVEASRNAPVQGPPTGTATADMVDGLDSLAGGRNVPTQRKRS
jgi:hypothetical protein